MRILLLSAYDAASHRRWRTGLAGTLDEHDWTVLSLPGRHFRWRIRGNSLYWAHEHADMLRQPWDAVIATSMVDLSALRGFVPELGAAHTVVYFHENQFAYPESDAQYDDVGPAVVNLYAAACADQLAFNSAYNRDSFLAGADDFLGRMPDFVPEGLVDQLEARSHLLPVPLDADCFGAHQARPSDAPLSIVWNHRWEYDKAPDRFFRALFALAERGLPFDLHVVGQSFRRYPPIFDQARERLAPHIATWGFVEQLEDYRDLLRRADVVVSTSLHEFQGLAMLEGLAMGCRALAPARLAYPEYIPEAWLYESYPADAEREAAVLADRLATLCRSPKRAREAAPVDVSAYRWEAQAPRYRALLQGESG